MPRFDPDRIRKMVSSIREAVKQLSDLAGFAENEFLSDPHKISSAKYNFIVAIEAAIDMGNHIISQNGFRAPEDYKDTFTVLSENGVFDAHFVKDLRNMAGFRNRLVHLYWEVDDKQVYKIIKTRLDDFGRYLKRVSRFLELDRQGLV